LHHIVAGHALSFRFVGKQNAVAENIGSEAFHVLGSDVITTIEESDGTCRESEINGASR
jgi:hypothetical protein